MKSEEFSKKFSNEIDFYGYKAIEIKKYEEGQRVSHYYIKPEIVEKLDGQYERAYIFVLKKTLLGLLKIKQEWQYQKMCI